MVQKVNFKHIIIDARLYGPKHTGLGRYTKNLLIGLISQKNFSNYRFTLIVYPELLDEIKNDLGNNFHYVTTTLRHYSLSEQLFLPSLLAGLKPDLVHFTHLDKPIFYFGKSVVTVHDLIRHFSKGSSTTTKNPWLYWPKYWGYLLMTRVILATSYIIVPSNFWRNFIIKKYRFPSHKIITTYEAVDPNFSLPKHQNFKVPQNYLIYTGNLYPHKNIDIVLQALSQLPKIKLKIICARSAFNSRVENLIAKYHLQKQVEFLGYVTDQQFFSIYSSALALVHPSLLEGFSLTGLEAMSLNCPVISSNSSCLPEIYQDSVLYFDPLNSSELIDQIKKIQSQPQLRQQLITKGHNLVSQYSWSTTAQETLNFYQSCLK